MKNEEVVNVLNALASVGYPKQHVPPKEITLSECPNILHAIASAYLKYYDTYTCIINGQKTIVKK